MMNSSTAIDLAPARRLVDRHLAHDAPFEVAIDSLNLTIFPGVFCPAYTKTSAFLAKHVHVAPGETVLDVFSGSGYQGLMTAQTAAKVVCVDSSPEAARCAMANAEHQRVSDKVTVLVGDLFDPVTERYDVVIANPPLLPGTPANAIEAAIFDPDLTHSKKFLERVGDYLTAQGRAYLIATDAHQDMGILDVIEYSEECGLSASAIAHLPLPYETYTVYRVSSARAH
ncbi:methyltransferase [Streptomyces sp. MNP-20]|uniref:methyltransferase n=1 Tax=Streptomyces sp. MNP-20 TaxID=2721165 RepID=UPI00155718D5|nr:methyltransferase [Streptomyces sp. MNP-20]